MSSLLFSSQANLQIHMLKEHAKLQYRSTSLISWDLKKINSWIMQLLLHNSTVWIMQWFWDQGWWETPTLRHIQINLFQFVSQLSCLSVQTDLDQSTMSTTSSTGDPQYSAGWTLITTYLKSSNTKYSLICIGGNGPGTKVEANIYSLHHMLISSRGNDWPS